MAALLLGLGLLFTTFIWLAVFFICAGVSALDDIARRRHQNRLAHAHVTSESLIHNRAEEEGARDAQNAQAWIEAWTLHGRSHKAAKAWARGYVAQGTFCADAQPDEVFAHVLKAFKDAGRPGWELPDDCAPIIREGICERFSLLKPHGQLNRTLLILSKFIVRIRVTQVAEDYEPLPFSAWEQHSPHGR